MQFELNAAAEHELMHTDTIESDDKWEIALGRESVKINDDDGYDDGKNNITL